MPDSMLVYLNTEPGKIQPFHKGIVCPNGIVRTDVLLDAWRKQLVLLACACDVWHPDLEISPDSGAIIGNHKRVVTQPEIVISSAEHGGRRYPPYAFTEQGVAMLSSVLNSSRAIAVNVQIMRAFVRMRELLASNRELAQKLAELERKIATHDQSITGILNAIRELMNPPLPKRRGIGFTANFDES
jgi:phage regulator Rha-like protein